jgi:hypothetical protein
MREVLRKSSCERLEPGNADRRSDEKEQWSRAVHPVSDGRIRHIQILHNFSRQSAETVSNDWDQLDAMSSP